MAQHARCNEEQRLQAWEDVRDYAAGKDLSVRWCPCTRDMRVSDNQFIETVDKERIYVSAWGWTVAIAA